MIASKKHNYVFVSVPKTGSLSIRTWLERHYDGQEIGNYYHSFNVPFEYRDAFKFIVARNPYERLFSLYHWRLDREREGIGLGTGLNAAAKTGFAALIEYAGRFGLQQHQFFDQVRADAFLRLEKLDEEIAAKLPFFDPAKPLPDRLRETPGKPAGSVFDHYPRDGAEAQRIRELFAADFDRFGYPL